jgi:hypothetical protein
MTLQFVRGTELLKVPGDILTIQTRAAILCPVSTYTSRTIFVACFFLFLAAQPALTADAPSGNSPSGKEIVTGFGLECRGAAGTAASWYGKASLQTAPIALSTAVAVDLYARQLRNERAMDFRSVYIEAGTGSWMPKPVSISLRCQYERFSLSRASLASILPMLSVDTRFFFLTVGCNFRTFALDEGTFFAPYFTHGERQFTFAIGGRCWPRENLSFGIAMRNFDDYKTGNFSTIGYEGDIRLSLRRIPFTLQGVIGYRPSGTIALTATPSAFVYRLSARKAL